MPTESDVTFTATEVGADEVAQKFDGVRRSLEALIKVNKELNAQVFTESIQTSRAARTSQKKANRGGLTPREQLVHDYVSGKERSLLEVRKAINSPANQNRRNWFFETLGNLTPEKFGQLSPNAQAKLLRGIERRVSKDQAFYGAVQDKLQPWARKDLFDPVTGLMKWPLKQGEMGYPKRKFMQDFFGTPILERVKGQYHAAQAGSVQAGSTQAALKTLQTSILGAAAAGDQFAKSAKKGSDFTNNIGTVARGVVQTTLREYLVGLKSFLAHALTPALSYQEQLVRLQKVMPAGVSLEPPRFGQGRNQPAFDFSGSSVSHLNVEDAIHKGLNTEDIMPAIRKIAADTGKSRQQILTSITQGIQGGALQPFGAGFHAASLDSYKQAIYQFGTLAAQTAVAFDVTDL